MKRRLLAAGALAVAATLVLSTKSRRYVLEREQYIRRSLDETVPFFENPNNLALITPPEMGFEITKIDGLPVCAGTRIEYRIRVLGVPQRWVAEIAEYEPGHRFVDVQVRGPYHSWRHEHTFEAIDGGTLMRDRVEYDLPFGIAGMIAQKLIVERQLQRIFDYRTDVIERVFGP